MHKDFQALLLLLGLGGGYILGMIFGYWFGKFYNLYKVFLLFWQDSVKLQPSTLTDAWDCYRVGEPHSQWDNVPMWSVFWIISVPVALGLMMPCALLEALWCRYVTPFIFMMKRRKYRLLPSWVSWSKLTEILNRII